MPTLVCEYVTLHVPPLFRVQEEGLKEAPVPPPETLKLTVPLGLVPVTVAVHVVEAPASTEEGVQVRAVLELVCEPTVSVIE